MRSSRFPPTSNHSNQKRSLTMSKTAVAVAMSPVLVAGITSARDREDAAHRVKLPGGSLRMRWWIADGSTLSLQRDGV